MMRSLLQVRHGRLPAALASALVLMAALSAPATARAFVTHGTTAHSGTASSRSRVVGKLSIWVQHMPASVTRRGRALKFTFDTRQTSRYVVELQFYLDMFAVGNNAAAHSETRGVALRWYDPATKRWMKPQHTDPADGWSLGPKSFIEIKHDQVLRIRVKMWFGKRAWAGLHQISAEVSEYAIFTASGKSVNASLNEANPPQYQFEVKR